MLTSEEKYKLIYRRYDNNKHCGNPVCPLCGNTYKEGRKHQSLDHHIEKYHPEIVQEYRELLNTFNNKKKSNNLICPHCGLNFKDLSRHLILKHGYKDLEDFKREFPEMPICVNKKFKIDSITCDVCGQKFKYRNAFGLHMKKEHNMILKEDKKHLMYSCAVCGFKTNNIKDHVVSKHKIEWENYCSEFNHNPLEKSFFTASHRKNLSKSKKLFYKSEKGLRRKAEQSRKFSGEKNPSKKEEVRIKISRAQCNNISKFNNSNFTNYSAGVRIKCPKIGLIKYCRSFQEFKVAYTCFKNNIKYEFEPHVLKINVNKKGGYLPDFKIGEAYFEIKFSIDENTVEKYEKIKASLKIMGVELKLLNYGSFCDYFSIKQLKEVEIIEEIKKLLNAGELFISYYSHRGKGSRLLSKISKNYKNHPFIDYNGSNRGLT